MPSKKTLPDHSPQLFETSTSFSAAVVDEIKAGFNIPESFRLVDRLNKEAYFYQWAVASSPPKISEQRQLLKAIHDQATSLDESLQKMGAAEGMRIDESIPGFSQFSLTQTSLNIRQLKHVTEIALGEIPQKPGRREDRAFKMLVFRLHELFREATGDDRKLTYNAYGDQYTGPAFGFICKCLPILDIHKDEQAIAAVIKEMVSVQGN